MWQAFATITTKSWNIKFTMMARLAAEQCLPDIKCQTFGSCTWLTETQFKPIFIKRNLSFSG